MRRIALPGLVALLAAALVALLVFGVLQTADNTSIDQAVAQGRHPVAHDARLPQLDGAGAKTLADYRGHYLVVNFFASWCDPCRAEAKLLEYENRLKIGYLLTDLESGERLTKGHSVQVAVHAATRELQFVSPAILLEKVGAAR